MTFWQSASDLPVDRTMSCTVEYLALSAHVGIGQRVPALRETSVTGGCTESYTRREALEGFSQIGHSHLSRMLIVAVSWHYVSS